MPDLLYGPGFSWLHFVTVEPASPPFQSLPECESSLEKAGLPDFLCLRKEAGLPDACRDEFESRLEEAGLPDACRDEFESRLEEAGLPDYLCLRK
jgi:hypothetical protein